MDKDKWIKTSFVININLCLCRKVLFEKYNPEKSRIIEMTDFFNSKINDCEIFKHESYPNSIFYIKKNSVRNEILMEQDLKNKVFRIKYTDFWSVFSIKFGFNYYDIQAFTKDRLEDTLKLQDYTTRWRKPIMFPSWKTP